MLALFFKISTTILFFYTLLSINIQDKYLFIHLTEKIGPFGSIIQQKVKEKYAFIEKDSGNFAKKLFVEAPSPLKNQTKRKEQNAIIAGDNKKNEKIDQFIQEDGNLENQNQDKDVYEDNVSKSASSSIDEIIEEEEN